METVRDIILVIFGLTGIITSLSLLFIGIQLYRRASRALERVGLLADDVHGGFEVLRSGAGQARGVLRVVGPVLPGLGWFRPTYRLALALPRAIRLISHFKKPPTPSA